MTYSPKALAAYGRALAGTGSFEDVAEFLPRNASVDGWVGGLPAAFLQSVATSGRLSEGELTGLAAQAAGLLTESEEGRASE